jgi:uncharacterized protein (DUF1330 family)
MAKGYWVVAVDVSDPERYKAYVAANAAPLHRYGGKFVTRGGQSEQLEGKMRKRIVVIEFPTYRAALDCYRSKEYQDAIKLRANASVADFAVLEGYDGPQP